jgi:hypothetical protein
MSLKFTNIFHCKTLRNLPKLAFLVWKYAIWQHRCWMQFFCRCWKENVVKMGSPQPGARFDFMNRFLAEIFGLNLIRIQTYDFDLQRQICKNLQRN